jgi:hypothetical protein
MLLPVGEIKCIAGHSLTAAYFNIILIVKGKYRKASVDKTYITEALYA